MSHNFLADSSQELPSEVELLLDAEDGNSEQSVTVSGEEEEEEDVMEANTFDRPNTSSIPAYQNSNSNDPPDLMTNPALPLLASPTPKPKKRKSLVSHDLSELEEGVSETMPHGSHEDPDSLIARITTPGRTDLNVELLVRLFQGGIL